MQIWGVGVGTHILGQQVSNVYKGSVMVRSDMALVSTYRLFIATMLLTETVWPQFAMQVFGAADNTDNLEV